MAYSISNWTTTRIERLVIPLSALYDIREDLKQRGWQPAMPRLLGTAGVFVRIDGLGAGWTRGELLPGCLLAVESICVHGEGSGVFYWKILVPALRRSTGILEAALIWEGGDSVSRLVVEDGEIVEGDRRG